MAFYVRTPWLSVNSGTDVVRSGTRDVRRQFRDCPGHSGTVGNPRLIRWQSIPIELFRFYLNKLPDDEPLGETTVVVLLFYPDV